MKSLEVAKVIYPGHQNKWTVNKSSCTNNEQREQYNLQVHKKNPLIYNL